MVLCVNDRESTESNATVTAAEIGRAPVTNALQAMQGRTPGITILQKLQVPGSNCLRCVREIPIVLIMAIIRYMVLMVCRSYPNLCQPEYQREPLWKQYTIWARDKSIE